MNKAPDAFRTISEVAKELDLPQHVLRFWESRFAHIKPLKRGGGRRYYRPEDVDLLRGIRHLLYGDGYTIRGVQRILREQGVRTVQSVGQGILSLPAKAKDEAEIEGFAPELPFPTAMLVAQDDEDDEDDYRIDDEGVAQPSSAVPVPLAVVSEPPAYSPLSSLSHSPSPEHPTPPGAENTSTHSIRPIGPPESPPLELDRLKVALAELEACRRLLNRALNEE